MRLVAGLDLHQAASAGDLEKIKALIAAGWEVDSLNSDRETPLHWAAARGQTQAVMALLHAGADPTRTDRSGRTPPAQALENGHGEVGQALAQISQQRTYLHVFMMRARCPSRAGYQQLNLSQT